MQQRHSVRRLAIGVMAAILLALGHAFAGQKPKEWNPSISPSDFVLEVTNPYFPLPAGKKWEYRSRSGNETLVIEVQPQKKSVMGVMTTVVTETGAVDGQTVEISENWFADTAGVTRRACALSPVARAPLFLISAAHEPGASHMPPSDSGLSLPLKLLVGLEGTENVMAKSSVLGLPAVSMHRT